MSKNGIYSTDNKEKVRIEGNVSKEEEEKHETFHSHLKEYAENASWNGLGSAARSKALLRLIFWIFMILTTTGLTIYHTYTITKEYLQFPHSTKIDYVSSTQLTFPAVTFCNLNPVLQSGLIRVQNDSRYFPLIEALESGWNIDDLTWRSNLTNLTSTSGGNWTSLTVYDSWTSLFLNDTQAFINYTGEYLAESSAYREFADLEDDLKANISTAFVDLLIDCSFAGQQCSIENFTKIQSPYYGNCYVFNAGLSGIPAKAVSRPGPRFGLEVKFLVQQEEYLPQFAKEAGIKVTINGQGEYPFPEDNGFSIPPGFQTNVGIQKVEIKRLKKPYSSKCVSLTSQQAYLVDAYAERYEAFYTVKGCLKSCFQRAVVRTCNCTDPFYSKTGSAIENSGVWYETCVGAVEEECVLQVSTDYEAGRISCADCKPPCQEDAYDKEISQSYWPASTYESDLYLLYLQRSPSFRELVRVTGDLPDIRLNSAKVAIYFRDLNYQKVEEDAKYSTVFNYLAEFGGIVGLWTGLSVIGMIEVVELLFDMCRISIFVIRRKVNEKSVLK